MATMNGYSYRQSSHLYTTDGDEIDYLYHSYRIFSFTMELYPVEMGNLTSDVYPPYTVVAKQTARNRGALLYLIDMAGCPYAAIGKAAKYCGGAQVSRPSGGLLP
jgi:carboxypeptidase T